MVTSSVTQRTETSIRMMNVCHRLVAVHRTTLRYQVRASEGRTCTTCEFTTTVHSVQCER